MKLLIKKLDTESIMFQGEVTTKEEYEIVQAMYPTEEYSRENIK